MYRRWHPLLLTLFAGCSSAPAPERAAPGAQAVPDDIGAASIRPLDFRARIGFLADDALRGRDTPSPGLEVAAAYIASEFRSFGLAPAGDSGSFIQRYPYVVRTLRTAEAKLDLNVGGAPLPLQYGADYYVSPGTSAASGALVLLGRAAELAELPAGSLTGSIAVADLADAPGQAAARVRSAAATAGATGLVLVLDSSVSAAAVAQSAANPRRGRDASIPVAYLRRDRAAELLRSAGTDLARLGSTDFRTVPLAAAAGRINAPAEAITHRPPNVVAMLRGSDPVLRDTYVVLSAHMDHVGVGRPDAHGDSIYNGADDDASGTAAVLEVAEAFAALPAPPARSLIFVAVSGEEKGLLGSAYFAEHLPVSTRSVIANINIDMIGRNAPDTVIAIGQDYSSLGPLVQEVRARHPELGLVVGQDPWPQERFFFRSDHFNFAKQEIPAIFFFTGTHEDYHRPSDHVEKIDLDKITRVTRLVYHLAYQLATDASAPAWTELGLAEVRKLSR
jgi:Zn-dependent M28 family amino/carboxypeptidase